MFDKEQLQLVHDSKLGVRIAGNVVVSAIGQADDNVRISNEINALQNILQLTLYFCKKYHVDLCTVKTRLQAFFTSENQATGDHIKSISPVRINEEEVPFVKSSDEGPEHVGIIRSKSGNLPHLLNRITSQV